MRRPEHTWVAVVLCAAVFWSADTASCRPRAIGAPPPFQSQPDSAARSERPRLLSAGRLGRIVYRSFSGRSAGVLAGGSAAALVAHTRDIETRTWAQDHRPPSAVLRVADVFGDYEFHVPALLAFWLVSRQTRNNALAGTVSALAEGYLLTKAVTMALKSCVGRTRPDGSDSWSFPSGHASGSFTLATVITCRHGFTTGLPFLSLAAFTTAMRVAQDKHYLSDIAAGAAIGIAIGRAAAQVHGPVVPKTTGVQFAPMLEYPLAVVVRW